MVGWPEFAASAYALVFFCVEVDLRLKSVSVKNHRVFIPTTDATTEQNPAGVPAPDQNIPPAPFE